MGIKQIGSDFSLFPAWWFCPLFDPSLVPDSCERHTYCLSSGGKQRQVVSLKHCRCLGLFLRLMVLQSYPSPLQNVLVDLVNIMCILRTSSNLLAIVSAPAKPVEDWLSSWQSKHKPSASLNRAKEPTSPMCTICRGGT